LVSVGVIGVPSASSNILAGILKMTQCVHTPPGASGSSTISARDTVPAGAPLQASAGDVFP